MADIRIVEPTGPTPLTEERRVLVLGRLLAELESINRAAEGQGRQSSYVEMTQALREQLGVPGPVAPLTIARLSEANLSRVEKWHSLDSWSPLEWAGAMCGEAGEAANAAKKLKRVEDQIANRDGRTFGLTIPLPEQERLYRKQVAMEVADVVIYGVLLAARVGQDLEACIREAFNRKSEEYGFPERV